VVIDETFSGAFQINEPLQVNGNVTIDSVVVDSITGFPQGLTWFSYPSPLVIYGDSSACISIIGTTYNQVDSGSYPLNFYGTAVVNIPGSGTQSLKFDQAYQLSDNIAPYYQLEVINYWDSCIHVRYPPPTAIVGVISAADWNVYPNPGNGNFNVTISAAEGLNGQLVVRDIMGRIVYRREVKATGHYQTAMDLTYLSPGTYMVQLISDEGVAAVPRPVVITSGKR
jgi:hypothetical protein